ncbi:MAG: hypothetical protein ACYC7D_10325 [Nitrososphaerales archaeon]
MPESGEVRFSIICDDEDLILSNVRSDYLWRTLETLIEILSSDSDLPSISTLMSWKDPHRRAVAKDPYSWRSVIDLIKNSDLSAKCAGRTPDELVLLTDKPTMLKIAGEITSALMHSYNLSHRITFASQIESKVPAKFAL